MELFILPIAEVSVIRRYECTVKTTQLVIMEDGIVQEYSGYENSTGVGDKLIFEILVPTETQESRQITFHLKDAKDSTLTWGYIFKLK